MHNYRGIFQRLLVSLLLCLNTSAYSLELGRVKVLSGLNQPCRLEIPILNPNHLPLTSIKVRFADKHGRKQVPILQGVIAHQQEEALIRIVSTQRITKPYLRFSLRIRTGQGEFKRRFLVLFDPVEYGTSS